MFRVFRGGYDIGVTYANPTTLTAALGTTVIAGDTIQNVWTHNCQTRYGYVNNSNAIVLTIY